MRCAGSGSRFNPSPPTAPLRRGLSLTSGKSLIGWIDRGRGPQATKETAISKDQKDLSAELLDAAKNCNESHIRSLLAAGADPNARGADGLTPLLHVADSGAGCVACAEALIAAGADPNAQGADGRAPLHYAAVRGLEDLVNFLIAAGADADIRCEDGLSPLHRASVSVSENVVKALLAAGADPNAQTSENGFTPLHYASGYSSIHDDENLGVIKALLAAGADPSLQEHRGRRPKDWTTDACKSVIEEAEILACLGPATAASKRPPL